jgi:hypothetical protein
MWFAGAFAGWSCGVLGMCSLWIVNQVLVRLWARRTSRWVWAVLSSVGGGVAWIGGGSVTVWHGLSDLGVGCCVSGVWPQVPSFCSVQGRYKCVLSELALLWDGDWFMPD